MIMGLHYYDFCLREEELFNGLDIINPEFDYSCTIFPKRFTNKLMLLIAKIQFCIHWWVVDRQ